MGSPVTDGSNGWRRQFEQHHQDNLKRFAAIETALAENTRLTRKLLVLLSKGKRWATIGIAIVAFLGYPGIVALWHFLDNFLKTS